MESTDLHEPDQLTEQTGKRVIRRQIVWQNVVGFLFMHLAAVYGLYVAVTSAKLVTWLYGKLKTYSLLICIF
jgi:stearoyl-CoA desaturase (delta-9 desaturase)